MPLLDYSRTTISLIFILFRNFLISLLWTTDKFVIVACKRDQYDVSVGSDHRVWRFVNQGRFCSTDVETADRMCQGNGVAVIGLITHTVVSRLKKNDAKRKHGQIQEEIIYNLPVFIIFCNKFV